MKHLGLLVTTLFLLTIPVTPHAEQKPILRILNWSPDYIDIDESVDESEPITERSPTLRQFMGEFHCTIEYDEYDVEDEMFKKVHNLRNYYDIVVVTSDIIRDLLPADRLAKISDEEVPNRVNILPKYRSVPGDPRGNYYIPYAIGTTGIVYRRDLVGHDIVSWKDYFQPSETMKGKLGSLDTQYLLCLAMKYLGIDIHTRDREEIKRAAKLFYDLKKEGFLVEVTSDIETIQAKLLKGDLAMAILYSGDALSVAEEDDENRIKYALPREGAEFYMDCMVVLNDAPHKELAYKFMNFVLRPEIHASIALHLNMTTPNEKSLEIIKKIKPEYLNDPGIYPPDDVTKKLEIIQDIDDDELRRMWQKISNPG